MPETHFAHRNRNATDIADRASVDVTSSRGGVEIPTGGDEGAVDPHRPARERLPPGRDSRFGANPKPTVIVRMRENRRHEAALSAPSEQEECVFTGIVEELGVIADREDLSDAARFTVRGPVVTADAGHGDSIAVNGVCLTVVDLRPGEFTVDVMGETLRRSSLSDLAAGSTVNLERAMPANGRFGGHIVQGHVDGTGTIAAVNPSENWTVVRIAVPAALTRYLVEKGSITVDGVSLTVSAVGGSGDDSWFEISLIPTTLNETNLGAARPGTVVNLEVDVIAKYVERLHLGSDTTGTPDVAGAK